MKIILICFAGIAFCAMLAAIAIVKAEMMDAGDEAGE
jgi:hypothetical protein